MKIIFIISSPRSGSKSLSYTLNNLKNVDNYHVPTELDDYNCKKYLGNLGKMNSIRANLIKESQDMKHHYIENAVCLMYHINDVILKYPDCKIIHLVRDGRDFVKSGMSRIWYKKDSQIERIGKISKLWVDNQKKIRENIPKKNYSGVIRMEDLSKDGVGNFIRKNLKLKFDGNIELLHLHKTKEYTINNWSKWDKNQRDVVEKIMMEELEFYGYKW